MASVDLAIDGPIATITNNNPEKHNAFDDDMDSQLWEVLAELKTHPEVRAVIWRGEGKSWSSGRDVGSIGNLKVDISRRNFARGLSAPLWWFFHATCAIASRILSASTPYFAA